MHNSKYAIRAQISKLGVADLNTICTMSLLDFGKASPIKPQKVQTHVELSQFCISGVKEERISIRKITTFLNNTNEDISSIIA